MNETDDGFMRIPGLFRIWDLQFVIEPGADHEVTYAETTSDGTALFMVFRRATPTSADRVQ